MHLNVKQFLYWGEYLRDLSQKGSKSTYAATRQAAKDRRPEEEDVRLRHGFAGDYWPQGRYGAGHSRIGGAAQPETSQVAVCLDFSISKIPIGDRGISLPLQDG